MKTLAALLLLIVGSTTAVYLPKQSDFLVITSSISMAFCGYLLFYTYSGKVRWKHLFILMVVLRILLIPAFPNLSDDIYRFYWDGMLVNAGVSPYRYLPTELISEFPLFKELITSQLNSPNYYSIYPPLNQAMYAFAYKLSTDIHVFCIALKTIYLLLEIPGLYLLFRYFNNKGKASLAFLYAGNPLVMIEGIGNLHIEVVMVSFLSIFFVRWMKHKSIWQQLLFYALAIGVKMVPLLLAPFFFFRQKRTNKVIVIARYEKGPECSGPFSYLIFFKTSYSSYNT